MERNEPHYFYYFQIVFFYFTFSLLNVMFALARFCYTKNEKMKNTEDFHCENMPSLKKACHFFQGQNDYEIYTDERTIGHSVTSPDETKEILTKLFMS